MRKGIQLGFAITFVVLIGNAVFAVMNTRALLKTEGRVVHTHDALRQLQAAHLNLRDAEAEQRSYLLTGDQAYITSYRAASGRLADDLTRLRELTGDNQSQQARVDAVGPLIGQWLDALGREIDLRATGGVQALAGRPLAEPAAIREAIGTMEETERALLAERSEQARYRAGQTL
jgi:CHASE3 domain sensor protein